MINQQSYKWLKRRKMSQQSPGILRMIERYEAVQSARNRYRLACRIRRISSQTYNERIDCLYSLRVARQGSFIPLIVDSEERVAATRLCGHKMMAAAVESEKLRWADPLAFRERSHKAEYSVKNCLILHHREAIASFRLWRKLP